MSRGGTEKRSRRELRELVRALHLVVFRVTCENEALRQDVRTANARLRHAARKLQQATAAPTAPEK